MAKFYLREVQDAARRFCSCVTVEDLQQLGIDMSQVQLLSLNPPYYEFDVPKSSGGFRHIEAPESHLKKLLRWFNFYLQCVYFCVQTKASFGYIIRVKGVKRWKNILENARSHLGAKSLLNVDFENFFHQISRQRVCVFLQKHPFHFDKKTAFILSKFFTHRGRLPMGSPTSPALSNLAVMEFDEELYDWSCSRELIFTRFVDDMTFSSRNRPIQLADLEAIKSICGRHGLKLNPAKTTFFDADDEKKVTGLVLNDTVDIEDSFYKELDGDLKRLKYLVEVSFRIENHNRHELVMDFKKEVAGKINFIGMIEGYDSSIFYKYRQRFKRALNPDEEALSSSWANFSYF